MRGLNSGDRLARGAVKVSYLTNEDNNVTQDTWDKAFDDFDADAFRKKGMPKMEPVGEKEISRARR